MECDRGVDPVWFRAVMRRQRQREAEDKEYVRQRDEDFRGKSMEEIESFLESTGDIPASPESTASTPRKCDSVSTPAAGAPKKN